LDAVRRKRTDGFPPVTPTRPASNRWSFAPGLLALLFVLGATPVFAAEAEGGGSEWVGLLAKIVNFAVLVGLLTYLLRNLIVTYLRARGESIRKDLTDAAALRQSADGQLAQVRARLAAMPAELDALRRLGQDELAGERVRMKTATEQERARLLERTQRDIDMQFRQARRQLFEHLAELSMTRTRARLERDITPDDQARLVDRYMTQVHS
jgi:F0F1-type ATP synthase membrane subunit b/b'